MNNLQIACLPLCVIRQPRLAMKLIFTTPQTTTNGASCSAGGYDAQQSIRSWLSLVSAGCECCDGGCANGDTVGMLYAAPGGADDVATQGVAEIV